MGPKVVASLRYILTPQVDRVSLQNQDEPSESTRLGAHLANARTTESRGAQQIVIWIIVLLKAFDFPVMTTPSSKVPQRTEA